METLVVQFQGFVTDLTTVEKRKIIALTEIARDALRTQPHLAASLVSVLKNRILQAPADLKLPVLYLLDSITKTIGEPYKTYFGDSLPDIYTNAWITGTPFLHRPLEKLLKTWIGVFPQHVLDAIGARMAAAGQVLPGSTNNGYPGYSSVAPIPTTQPQISGYGYYNAPAPLAPAAAGTHHLPMVPDSRLIAGSAPPLGTYDYYGGGYQSQQQQQQQQPLDIPGYGTAPPQAAPDLFSLLPSGALAAAAAAVTGSQQPLPTRAEAPGAMTRLIGIGSGSKGKPASLEFSSEQIKEHNPAAVERLLKVSNITKSKFLDRLFLRRQKRNSGVHASRLWYVDLDTWMAGTTGAGGVPLGDAGGTGAGGGGALGGPGGEISPEEGYSVVADDEQTHCALSGEKFDQFWDEDHQEWRYRDAKKLTADEAASYGLEEGAIVLVSALGTGPQVAIVGSTAAERLKKEEEEGADAKKEEEEEKEPARKRVKRET